MTGRIAVAAALALLPLLRPPPAGAHAFLAHADPAVGATVRGSPPAVTLAFTEPVEDAFSRIEVEDGHGSKVTVGPLQHPEPDHLSVSLPALAPGDYTVRWAVVSVDTHSTEGHFDFSVKSP